MTEVVKEVVYPVWVVMVVCDDDDHRHDPGCNLLASRFDWSFEI
jgi:hypothetical protein